MQISNQIRRFTLVIELLKKKQFPSKKDIIIYLEQRMQDEIDQKEREKSSKIKKGTQKETKTGVSERTLDRDIKDLRKNGFDIKYDPVEKGYYIEEVTQKGEAYSRMLDSLHLSQVFHLGEKIQLEKVGRTGYQYLFSMMDAIDNRKVIQFYYKKFQDDDGRLRTLAPYFIKEFKRRLYVIGKDYGDHRVKTFAFDRMSGAFVTNQYFTVSEDYTQYFDGCYGIVNDFESETATVLLKAYDNKAAYIETLPLHHSQRTVEKNEKYTIFELKVKISYDLVMELMSHANQLEVLQPKHLINELKVRLETGIKFYN